MPRTRRALPRLDRSIADSLDLPHAVLPVAAELFADTHALGTMAERAAHWLLGSGLRPGQHAVDLGCGKGAASYTLADHAVRVTGVDAHAPFLEAARLRTQARRFDHLCTWIHQDLNAFVRTRPAPFDAGLMLNVLPFDKAAPLLARIVKPGALVVLDDAVRLENATPDLADVPTARDAHAFFTARGFTVLRQHVRTLAESRAAEKRLSLRFTAQARRLARLHPRLRPALDQALRRHHDAARLLSGPVRPCLWLLRTPA